MECCLIPGWGKVSKVGMGETTPHSPQLTPAHLRIVPAQGGVTLGLERGELDADFLVLGNVLLEIRFAPYPGRQMKDVKLSGLSLQ
jgi:hypothetical protein